MTDRNRVGFARILFALFLLAAPLPASAETQGHDHGHANGPAETTVEFNLPYGTGDVLPLFLPGGRSLWDQEWDIVVTVPAGADGMGPGTRFHPKSSPETIWRLVSVDEVANVIEYEYEKSGVYDMQLRIECVPLKTRSTLIRVTYRAIGKTDMIAEALAVQLEQQIQDLVMGYDGWRDRMLYFLQKGTRQELYAPLTMERTHEFRLDATPDEVFAVANPAGGNHWSAGTPEYLFGGPDDPAGAMWRRGDNWFAIGEYDERRRVMSTILTLPETQILVETLRCESHPDGGTKVSVNWRVAGTSEEGNDAVREFFANHWQTRMAGLEKSYREKL